jgi:hypothetical protein
LTINNTQRLKLNKMNRASQDILLGDVLQGLQNSTASLVVLKSGATMSGSLVIANGSSGLLLDVTQSNSSGSVARFGDGTNYTIFRKDGSMFMAGSATVWDDLVVPLTTAKQGANDKPAFDETNVGYLFPSSDTSAIMYMIVQFPHAWKQGSRIFPHVHWQQGASGSVVFSMEYRWQNIGDPVSASALYNMTIPETLYTSGSIHQINNNPTGIDGIGKTISSIMLIKLYRNDNTYTGNALTYQFDIHIEKDSLGSKEEYSK